LISIADTPRREIARRVEGVGDVETIISRLFLMYPLEPASDIPAALDFAGQYVSTLPDTRRKIVVLITSKGQPVQTEAAARLNRPQMEFHLVQFPFGGRGPLSGRSGLRKTTPQQARAASPVQTTPPVPAAPAPAGAEKVLVSVTPEPQAEPAAHALNVPPPVLAQTQTQSAQSKASQSKTSQTRTVSKNQTSKQALPESVSAPESVDLAVQTAQAIKTGTVGTDEQRVQDQTAHPVTREMETAAVSPEARNIPSDPMQNGNPTVHPETQEAPPQQKLAAEIRRPQLSAPVQPQTAQTVVTPFLTRSSQVRPSQPHARTEPEVQVQSPPVVSPERGGPGGQTQPQTPGNVQPSIQLPIRPNVLPVSVPAIQPVQTAAIQPRHTGTARQAEAQVRIARRVEPSSQPVRAAGMGRWEDQAADKIAAAGSVPFQGAQKEPEEGQQFSGEQRQDMSDGSVDIAPPAASLVKTFELLPPLPALGDSTSLLSPFCMALGLSMAISLGFLMFRSGRQLQYFPNKTMAYVTGGALSLKTESRISYPLTEYAAKQQQRSLSAQAARPGKAGAGLLMLSLFVEDQNAATGRRNIHAVKPGCSYTIGGGNSDYLIFLLPLPPRIAEIYAHEDGSCTFMPKRPRFFPELGSNALPDCIGKTIRIISGKNYELFIRLERYEDPLKSLDWLLQAIKPPNRQLPMLA
jgi:hypothetical protein